jgi:hypothetical protein
MMKSTRLALLLSVCFVIPVAGETEGGVPKDTKKDWVLVSGHASPAVSQIEHAPTPDQCRADADAWGIPTPDWSGKVEQKFAIFSNATARDTSLTAHTLDARMKELSQCMLTDKMNSTRYAEAGRAYAIAQLVRMANFMKRHNLSEQFHAEDEQGQR